MNERIVFEHIREIDSTNAELSRRIAAGKHCGSVCLSADCQTAGRGRRGRSWLNTDGALLMSLCRDTAGLDADALPLVSISAALGTHDAVSSHLDKTAIKWPNDIVCMDSGEPEKLCGILCELVHAPNGERYALIGIGVNVNCRLVPADLRMPAASMQMKLGAAMDAELLKKQIASAVFMRLNELKSDPITLVFEYSLRCITLNRSVIACDIEGRSVAEGIAKRILADGRLVIETVSGEVCVDAADVSIKAHSDAHPKARSGNS